MGELLIGILLGVGVGASVLYRFSLSVVLWSTIGSCLFCGSLRILDVRVSFGVAPCSCEKMAKPPLYKAGGRHICDHCHLPASPDSSRSPVHACVAGWALVHGCRFRQTGTLLSAWHFCCLVRFWCFGLHLHFCCVLPPVWLLSHCFQRYCRLWPLVVLIRSLVFAATHLCTKHATYVWDQYSKGRAVSYWFFLFASLPFS